MTINLLSFV